MTVAGLVLVRQRPGTAKGVIFLTLEDETGIVNIVVWPKVFERNRRTVMTAQFLAVRGRIEREGLVIHVVAEELIDLTDELRAPRRRHRRHAQDRQGGARRLLEAQEPRFSLRAADASQFTCGEAIAALPRARPAPCRLLASILRGHAMEPAAILEQLTYSDDLPRDALRAAAELRADMVPLFVERIESYVAADSAEQESRALFFIFHLLGDWRETSTYHSLARLLRCPPEQIDAAIGWSITETSHRVMAAVFDGDPQPIYNIILDENADQFARSRMCDALAMLVLQGKLDRSEVASFLRDCWISLQPRDDCYVWSGWVGAIAMLGLVELKSIVKEAFDRRIIHRELAQLR